MPALFDEARVSRRAVRKRRHRVVRARDLERVGRQIAQIIIDEELHPMREAPRFAAEVLQAEIRLAAMTPGLRSTTFTDGTNADPLCAITRVDGEALT